MPTARLTPALVLLALSLTFATACGSSNSGADATAANGVNATATFNAIERRTFGPTSAVADVTIGGDTVKIDGGNCRAGAGDRFFILKAGSPTGPEYLYILMGRYPASRPFAKITTGGGTFGAADGVGVALRHNSQAIELTTETGKVTLAADISSGTLTGTTKDGLPYSAKFTC